MFANVNIHNKFAISPNSPTVQSVINPKFIIIKPITPPITLAGTRLFRKKGIFALKITPAIIMIPVHANAAILIISKSPNLFRIQFSLVSLLFYLPPPSVVLRIRCVGR